MKAIGYVRVSTDRQELSVEYQAKKIRAYAELNDIELVDIKTDNGKSGKNTDRPAMQEVLKLVKSGDIDAVIVLKIDRLTRSIKDLSAFKDLIIKHDVALISVTENIDTSSSMGKFFLNVLGIIAELERDVIIERTKAALDVKKSHNEKLGGYTPYGFDSLDGQLVKNTEEQKVISLMKRWRNAGDSFQTIADKLNERGIATKKNAECWQKTSIRRVLLSVQ